MLKTVNFHNSFEVNAKNIAEKLSQSADLKNIEQRILDMKLRMKEEDFNDLERKYAK